MSTGAKRIVGFVICDVWLLWDGVVVIQVTTAGVWATHIASTYVKPGVSLGELQVPATMAVWRCLKTNFKCLPADVRMAPHVVVTFIVTVAVAFRSSPHSFHPILLRRCRAIFRVARYLPHLSDALIVRQFQWRCFSNTNFVSRTARSFSRSISQFMMYLISFENIFSAHS